MWSWGKIILKIECVALRAHGIGQHAWKYVMFEPYSYLCFRRPCMWNAMSEVLWITWVGFRLLLVCHLTSSWYWKVCYCSSASRWKKSWRVWEIWSSKSKLSFTIKLEYNRFRFQEWTVPFSNETFCLVKTSFLAPVILGKKWMWNSFFPQMKHFVLWRSQGWNLNPKFTNYMKRCCMSCFLEIPVGGTILRNNFQDWLKLFILVQYEVSSSRLNFWFTVKNEYCLCCRSSIFGFKWQVLPVVALFSPSTSLFTQSLVQLYVNILWGTFVIEGRCVHLDIPKEKRQWCVSTGWEVFARRVINVNFSMNMTWRRCLSVISIPSLVSYR